MKGIDETDPFEPAKITVVRDDFLDSMLLHESDDMGVMDQVAAYRGFLEDGA